jgi:hypothetical protein
VPGRVSSAGKVLEELLLRATIITIVCALLLSGSAEGQTAVVSGQVVLEGGQEPLGYTTVSVLSEGRQLLSSGTGRFVIDAPAGEVRLRFKRIGFAPRDTALRLAAGDTARLRVEMKRLVIQLPEMVVTGKCTNETPREPVPGFLAQLIDQVVQNAERMTLLAHAKPFQIRFERIDGYLRGDGTIDQTRGDTALRAPLPDTVYAPKKVMFLITAGPYRGAYGVKLPELPDIADSAFINNHCFRYAGRALVGADSVIRVEFEPVPWLDREYDIMGTLYLKLDGYQMVGSFTRLNRLRPQGYRAGLEEYFVESRFREIVPGIPLLDWYQLTNRYRTNRPSFVQRGRLIGIEWKDSTGVRPDTAARRR